MAPLSPSGLETASYGTQGWNAIFSANFEKINTKLGHLMSANSVPGTVDQANNSTTQEDPAATTAEELTDSTGGTAANTIAAISGSGADVAINNAIASLIDEINKLRADNVELRAKLIGTIDYNDALKATINGLLAKLRKTTGVGVLSN